MTNMADKIKGCLFGVACGDALGATLEFMSREEIRKKYGRLTELTGGGHWRLKPGEVTDDTKMTVAVARGIVSNPVDPIPCIREEFIKWFQTDPPDIGTTTKIALNLLTEGLTWEETAGRVMEIRGEHAAGNGSLMRTAPVALAYLDEQLIRDRARKQSMLTHPHPDALFACELYCLILREILTGSGINSAIWSMLEREDREDTYHGFLQNAGESEIDSGGYVVSTLRTSLWCLLRTSNFEEAVVKAVNFGDDADTCGAVTGGLAGAYYGYKGIPDRWKKAIVCRDELSQLAQELYRIRSKKA
ncbi:ADP-ribosylglycohydrolase family protein [Thermincola ferriacetica]